MKTSHTICIKLNESGEERTVVLSPGWRMQVSVGGDGKLRIECSSGDVYVWQTRQMMLKDDEQKKLKDENVRLESIIDSLLREREDRKSFDECFIKLSTTEHFRRLMEEQSQKIVQTHTELETRCFASQCRVSRIRQTLDGYITSRGGEWMQNDWVVVHKVFCDLQWWKGKDKEFVAWVNESGYALTEHNFKKTKNEIRGVLEQWYTMTGNDHFVQTARDLYDLFAGGPLLPKAAAYENGYIYHAGLTARIYRDTAASRGVNGIYRGVYKNVNYKIDGIVMGQKINPISILLPIRRHNNMGTVDGIGIIKSGRIRRRPIGDLHPTHRF